MNTAPDGRRIFPWLGQDPIADSKKLADAIAESCVAKLFNLNGLVWLDGTNLVPVNIHILREIVAQHFVSVRLLNGAFGYTVEYFTFDFPAVDDTSKQPNQRVLLGLIDLLLPRVMRGPVEPRVLMEHQIAAIKARHKEGEPISALAEAYGCDAEQIRRLTQQ